MTIYFFLPKSRQTVMARIWYKGKSQDTTTRIKIPKQLKWDQDAQRVASRSREANDINNTLLEWESSKRKEVLEVLAQVGDDLSIEGIIKIVKGDVNREATSSVIEDTFQGFLEQYRKLMDNKLIYSWKGNPLSDSTTKTRKEVINSLVALQVDFDFGKYNIATLKIFGKNNVLNKYESFGKTLKNKMFEKKWSPNTIFKRLMIAKHVINYCCDRKGIEIPSLDYLKYNKPPKRREIFALPVKHTDFILNNYHKILMECTNKQQQEAITYAYVIILTCARKGDVDRWTDKNIVTKEDGYWLRYMPAKTKHSSGVVVEHPIPDTVMEIFQQNIAKHKGRLMPPSDINANRKIRKVLAKFHIFREEIQYVKKGELHKGMLCQEIYLHGLRSTGISHKLAKGMPEHMVKMYSGHTIDSTSYDVYVKVYDDNKMEQHRKYMESSFTPQIAVADA